MARRIIAPKPSVEHVHQIQSTFRAVETSFQAKNDPQKILADEIETFRKLIWECVGGQEKALEQPKASSNKLNQANQIENPTSSVDTTKSALQGPKKSNPSRVNIEFRVNAMKVVELRKELRERDMDTNGLKKQLKARLLQAMFEEAEGDHNNIQAPKVEVVKQNISHAPAIVEVVKPPAKVMESSTEDSKKEITEKPKAKINEQSTIPMSTTNIEEVARPPAAISAVKPSVEVPQREQPILTETPIEPKDRHEEIKEQHSAPKASETAMQVDEEPVVKPKSKPVEQGSTNVKNYWKNLSKPTQKGQTAQLTAPATSRPAKKSKSPIKMVVKNTYKPFAKPMETESTHRDLMEVESKEDFSLGDDIVPTLSDSNDSSKPKSAGSFSSESAGLAKTNSVKDMVSKIQSTGSFSSTSSTMNMNSTTNMSSTLKSTGLSKNLQAKKDARMARMAEIRGKSKPVITSKVVLAPKEYSSTLSSLNAVSAPASNKKKNLATQMREKAAAAALRKENMSANQMQTSTTGTGKRNLQSAHSGDTAQDNLTTSMKQGFSKKPKVASPMDTYEISDREESDSDSDSEGENEKQKKKIPGWAQKANLLPALEQQYNGCIAGIRVDPDDIFPEVQTCDLEAIFGGKKSRYTRRTSSGNWARDKVTVAEKLVYKRTMGFSTSATDS